MPWANKISSLRPYQEEVVAAMEAHRRGIVNLATGLGKTLSAVHAIRKFHKKTLIICPNKSIAEQFHSILAHAFGKNRIGFIGSGKQSIKDITVGIAPSIANHIEAIKKIDLGLVIFDEAHHTPASTFFTIAKGLSKVGRMYGLTATDFRSDGKDLLIEAGCGSTIISRDASWGIKNGWLATPFFIVRNVPTTGKNYKDDKLKNYKTHVLNSPQMKAQIESDAQKFISANKRVLILVDEVAHGVELSTNLGIPFATGEDKQSQSYIDQFNDKKILGLVATEGKAGEGVDTRPVDVLILANFAVSKGTVLQTIGRGLRKVDGKENVIILDYKPLGSDQLSRHTDIRIKYFKELTDKVKIVN